MANDLRASCLRERFDSSEAGGSLASLRSPAWIRKHPAFHTWELACEKNSQLKVSYRLLVWLLDLLSSRDPEIVKPSLFTRTVNRAVIADDEIDVSPVSLGRITLPDGSIHERPV